MEVETCANFTWTVFVQYVFVKLFPKNPKNKGQSNRMNTQTPMKHTIQLPDHMIP